MNEPHMAAWWFPANDHPRDKALMDIHITVPKDKQVIANGHRVGRKVQGGTGHRALARRRADGAVPRVLRRRRLRGRPRVTTAVCPGTSRCRGGSPRRSARRRWRWCGARRRSWPGSRASSATTPSRPPAASSPASTRGSRSRTRPGPPTRHWDAAQTWLLVHELAHQWFGDSVSVENWRDVWLNEGPATFMEVRYDAQHGGVSEKAWLERRYTGYPATRPSGTSAWPTPARRTSSRGRSTCAVP